MPKISGVHSDLITEARMERTSGVGAVDTNVVRFTNLIFHNGTGFSINTSANNGTVITINKAGVLSIDTTLVQSAAALFVYVTRGQTVLTGDPSTNIASVKLVSQGISGNTHTDNPKWEGTVQAGDIIRIAASAAPVDTTTNNLNILLRHSN